MSTTTTSTNKDSESFIIEGEDRELPVHVSACSHRYALLYKEIRRIRYWLYAITALIAVTVEDSISSITLNLLKGLT